MQPDTQITKRMSEWMDIVDSLTIEAAHHGTFALSTGRQSREAGHLADYISAVLAEEEDNIRDGAAEAHYQGPMNALIRNAEVVIDLDYDAALTVYQLS